MDEVNDDIINDADGDEGRFHRMFSRILNLKFFLTKFGTSFQVRSKLEIKMLIKQILIITEKILKMQIEFVRYRR